VHAPEFKPFDVIELVVPIEGHEAGERGTVIVEGVTQALVYFGWRDRSRPPMGTTARVKVEAMRLVEPGPGRFRMTGRKDRAMPRG
jgi:hypothetical protein